MSSTYPTKKKTKSISAIGPRDEILLVSRSFVFFVLKLHQIYLSPKRSPDYLIADPSDSQSLDMNSLEQRKRNTNAGSSKICSGKYEHRIRAGEISSLGL